MTSGWLILSYLVLAATLMQALLVKAHFVRSSCGRCGLPLERRELGERVCRCRAG